ncbi:MAG: ATP-binding protein [bacterium]
MYSRKIEKDIDEYLAGDSHKIFFIWGPRRSGKTTVLKELARKLKVPIFNFDVISDQAKFKPDRRVLQSLVKDLKVILIDEVQSHEESTIALKILYDEFDVKVIATGSSELRQKTANFDSLAGRFVENYCLPLSLQEISSNNQVATYDQDEFASNLATNTQIFGSYPEVYTNNDQSEKEKVNLLQNVLDTYVLKDVINIYNLKDAKLAKDILTKIALQVGSEVSLREIANSLGANVSTVSNYIEIFVKNYILLPLPSFKTNLRRAVSENRKYYFYDLGIRNVLIRDFRPLEFRPDRGGVWENFIISEFEKKRRNDGLQLSFYFYREYSGQEVDLVVEDYHKTYRCYEIKASNRSSHKSVFPIIHQLTHIVPDNYFAKISSL